MGISMQVLKTLRSNVPVRGGDSEATIAVYLVNARECVEVDERRLKDAVRDVGGRWNQSCLFLPATSTATVVNSETGEYKKSVVKIPRNKASPQLVDKLDGCTLALNWL